MSPSIKREIDRLDDVIRRLGQYAESPASLERVESAISVWAVAQHLFHVVLSTGAMLKVIEMLGAGADQPEAGDGPNEIGAGILARGRIQRGIGQAPDKTVPPERVEPAALTTAIARLRRRRDSLVESSSRIGEYPGRYPHPYFGNLNAQQWLSAAVIHAEHHMLIVEDILTRQSPS